MANIGDQLLQPESGMQRIDGSNINIKYSGTWTTANSTPYYNGSNIGTTVAGDSMEFYFYGTKLVLMDSICENRTNSVEISIDNNTETFSCYSSLSVLSAKCQICTYEKHDLERKIHHIKITNNDSSTNRYLFIDCIDIDEDGKMCTEREYEIQEMNNKKFPVMIGDSTITSETNIANYASTLTNGERQLLIMESGKMFLTDGNGSYIKINNMGDLSNYVTQDQIKDIKDAVNHDNRDVLDLLSTNGNDLFFNGKNVQKVELENGQYGYTTTIMNALTDNIYTINIDKGSKMCDQIVQAWEFTEGGQDITTIAKTFNNAEKSNFYYDSEFVEFNENECKVKDTYKINLTLNNDTGFYESEVINLDKYVDLKNIEEVNN